MNSPKNLLSLFVLIAVLSGLLAGQQASPSAGVVPHLVNYSGRTMDAKGTVVSGVTGVTFAIYKEQYEGAPLWMETQNVTADSRGTFTVQLGATKSEGLPVELFSSGEARWLGVRVSGGEEQPRVMLLSVPYALKAGDAATVGGLPPSAFVLAGPPTGGAAPGSSALVPSAVPSTASNVTTTGGTANTLPLFTTGTNIQSSALTQTGTGATAKIGIGVTAPVATLDVKGPTSIRGNLGLASSGNATAAAGKNSQPQTFSASSFSSGTSAPVNQNLRWQAEPAGNDTASPSATLNFLYGSGTSTPAETGLKISSNGQITFAKGQTFPGSGSGKGTVTSVGLTAPYGEFTVTGSPVTGSGTLALSWIVPPTSQNLGDAIVERDASGNIEVSDLYSSLVETYEVVAAQINSNTDSNFPAIQGEHQSGLGPAILGLGYGTGTNSAGWGPDGVDGQTNNAAGAGIGGYAYGSGDGVFAYSTGGFAAFFLGNVDVDGIFYNVAGANKIDHPLDPANKYLYHSSVESPDMMNLYNGVAVLNANGEAVVNLPEYFESLNRDFRYQLTAIGMPGPNLHIAEKVHSNTFRIAGGQPGMEVSWQVTGVRQDAWANAHRIPVEQMKAEEDRGHYLHPELFGAPAYESIAAAHRPAIQKRLKEKAVEPIASAGQGIKY